MSVVLISLNCEVVDIKFAWQEFLKSQIHAVTNEIEYVYTVQTDLLAIGVSSLGVKRIVCNIEGLNLDEAKSFYQDILGLSVVMDLGWIRTYAADCQMAVQLSMASEGGCGAPVPDLSIEVDDFESVLAKVRQVDMPIEYGPKNEPWGVRRFYVRDPFGKVINILEHL